MTSAISKKNIPQHIAVIMDGNGRWAESRGLSRTEGHKKGAETVETITETARELGIKYLTLYAFSKENWKRPSEEVQILMRLLMDFLFTKKEKMISNGIRLHAIGDLSALAEDVRERLSQTISDTQNGNDMVLTLCLSYGARDELLRAMTDMFRDIKNNQLSLENISDEEFSQYLDTKTMPDPDLVIRTSGEKRISNFLLWQSAYAEYAFVNANWPDFSAEDFTKCIQDYQNRERRFGKTSAQIDCKTL